MVVVFFRLIGYNMAKPVPRASILVTFFNDPDTLGLMANGNDGPRAVLMFIGLLVLAKDLHNKGEFKGTIEIYSGQLMLEPKRSRRLFNLLARPELRWVEEVHPGFKIRSWEKHNVNPSWGGYRPNSGPKNDSSSVQDEPNLNTKMDHGSVHLGYTSDSDLNSDSELQQQQQQPRGREASLKLSAKPKIEWTDGVGWTGISDADRERWAAAYPACNIDLQLARMNDWLVANPTKRKSNYPKFITNWLIAQQDRGGDRPAFAPQRPQNDPPKREPFRMIPLREQLYGKGNAQQ